MSILIRLLQPLAKNTNAIKNFNKKILPLANPSCIIACKVEQRRHYAERKSNIIRSPFSDMKVPDIFLSDKVWKNFDKWSDLTALVCGITGRSLKYRQLRSLSKKLATSLLKEGYKPREVIAIIMPNMPEYGVVALGILEAGLIVTTINPIHTADEMFNQLKDSRAVGIVTVPDHVNKVLAAKAKLEKENKEYSSKLRIICTTDLMGTEQELPSGVDRYSSLVADNIDESALPSLQTRDKNTNDIAFIPYSSGTTGRPKGVCLTHRNLIASIMNMEQLSFIYDANGSHQEVIPLILPAFHIYGFNIILMHSLCKGAKIVTLPKFEEKSFLKIMETYDFTVMFVAPPLVLYLGGSPNVRREHLRSVKHIISGAAPVAESDIMKCVEKSPPTVEYKQAYGLTETSPGICAMVQGIKKYSSVGSPLPNTLVKVVDINTNQALGPNEEGEICVKGPQIMKCYLNNEKATAEMFDQEGWMHTGDIGYYDQDEHFYVTDRIKELIKVKGFQVAPAELEGLLRTHPEVEDAGVVGVPDPRKGETPVGFVKLKTGSKATQDELKAFLAPKIANYKQIDKIIFVDSIPKTVSGKISRKDLKANYLKSINSK